MLSIVQKLNTIVKDKMSRFIYFVILLSEFRSHESAAVAFPPLTYRLWRAKET